MGEIYGRVYCITNQINRKVYIGQTIRTIEERLKIHFYDSKYLDYYIYRAINKYGKENFSIKEIDIAYNKEELNEKERKHILENGSFNPQKGYNSTMGGEGTVPNEETRKKMSEAQRGKNNPMYGYRYSEEEKQLMSEKFSGEKHPQFGTHHSEETKQKISKTLKSSMFGKTGENNPNFGKHPSEATRKKMRKSHQGKKNPMFGKTGKDSPGSKKVMCVETGEQFESMREIERKYGYCSNNICNCCKGKRKTCGGFHWQYI